jgi:hypothetical protein
MPLNRTSCLFVVAAITVSFMMVVAPVRAAATLNLPSTLVTIIVTEGNESHFNEVLSNVPEGYDVTNATYLGWCIDASTTMTRNETFGGQLYSSLSPPAGNWSTARWDVVNYILNHKQGNNTDTQQAIWFFINNTISFQQTLTPAANATVEDALANGTGFSPNPGQIVAGIVFPQIIIPGSGPFQDSIIEIRTQPLQLTVDVTVSGNAVLIGTNTYHIDSGASATFTAVISGGTSPYNYTWYVNGAPYDSNQTTTFSPQQTGTYTIYANVMDNGNPIQQASSVTYTVTVPETPVLAVALLAASTFGAILITRKKA